MNDYGENRRRGTWRNAEGIRTYVMGYDGEPGHHTSYDLYFDDTGERLVGARGKLPPEFDLADGWGRGIAGMYCGLGVSRKKGTLNEIKLSVTIRNTRLPVKRPKSVSDEAGERNPGQTKIRGDARLPMGSLYYKPRLINKDGKVYKTGEVKHAKLNPHAFRDPIPRQIIAPGKVRISGGPRPLSDWFQDIPEGEYQLLVTNPDEDLDMSLVSNTVNVTITRGG